MNIKAENIVAHGRGSVARKKIGTNVYDTSTPNVKATEICSFLGINSNPGKDSL